VKAKARLVPVEVEWIDSAFTRGWRDPDEMLSESGCMNCISVGYLIRKTPKMVTIVQSHHDLKREQRFHDSWSEALSIPRSCVRKIRRLR
jgi:hypothetical protein